MQVFQFHRDQCFQVLSVYSQDSIVLFRIFNSIINIVIFQEIIEEFLRYYKKYPEERSVLVLDNTVFYYSERVEQLCFEKEVKWKFPLLYSPDLNPTEESFAELEAFIGDIGISTRKTLVKILKIVSRNARI